MRKTNSISIPVSDSPTQSIFCMNTCLSSPHSNKIPSTCPGTEWRRWNWSTVQINPKTPFILLCFTVFQMCTPSLHIYIYTKFGCTFRKHCSTPTLSPPTPFSMVQSAVCCPERMNQFHLHLNVFLLVFKSKYQSNSSHVLLVSEMVSVWFSWLLNKVHLEYK